MIQELFMKILIVNKFFFMKGGAETFLFKKAKLLKDNGHDVLFFSMEHPDNYNSSSSEYFVSRVDFDEAKTLSQKITIAGRVLYSLEAKRNIERLIKVEKPDIAHLHNIYHQLSPSIFHILKKYDIPIIMTLHDYKLVCPVYTLLDNDGNICERCKGKRYYWCLLKKCNKGLLSRSFLNTLEMYLHQKILHVYDLVDLFISPSIFLKEKFKEMGFNIKVIHIPNFINANDYVPSFTWDEASIVYFGRLSKEKGLFTLLSAVKGLKIKCKIIGDGPMKESLIQKAKKEELDNVIFLGYKTGEELEEEIRKSAIVILPSEWYENYPYSVLEAFALGKPVVGSRIGGIPELVKDNRTGLTFQPKNPDDLREKILYMFKNSDKIIEMGKNGRRFVEEVYEPQKYYEELIGIYQSLMNKNKKNNL